MKVLISADMEGTCGVVAWVQVMPPEYAASGRVVVAGEYERARQRMTQEVNAAIEGALAGGAEEVIVNDSHDGMRNLIPDDLHPAARYISGEDKPLGMTQGVDLDGVGALFFTGYHAQAGTPAAPLAHTWSGWLNDVRFDGRSVGEWGLNAAVAGHFGVPVLFVAGDDKAVAQTRDFCGEQVVGVAVKEGLSTFAALHLHPARARDLIRTGAEEAARRALAGQATPYRLPHECPVELEFEHQARADQAVYVPGVERAADRTVRYRPTDALQMILTFNAIMQAAAIKV
jgi:D-amino peptidase